MSGHSIPRRFNNFAQFFNYPVTFDPSRDPNWDARKTLEEDVQAHLRGKDVLRPETPRLPLRTLSLSDALNLTLPEPERCSPAVEEPSTPEELS